jgi:glycosyltransferase involved in cell wall biosynthesis
MKLPISAIVVTKNESRYLKKCLAGIDYCDEVIVIDLQSTDDSVKIAEQAGANVIVFDPVPYVEIVHEKIKNLVRNQWVLITDPDEVADERLKIYITSNFALWSSDPKVGCVRAPMIYYVGERPIVGTGWGPTNKSRVYIVNLERYEFSGEIHKGRKIKEGFSDLFIDPVYGVIHHYWVESLSQLIIKCKGYLEHEKKVPEKMRRGFFQFLKTPFITFYSSYIVRRGYKDGLLGFNLSIILSWYNLRAALNNRSVTRKTN